MLENRSELAPVRGTYESPLFDVIRLNAEDIITTSGNDNKPFEWTGEWDTDL